MWTEYYPEGYGCELDSQSSERLKHYEMGGLCPITLDQVLNKRYKVFDKLGFGAYSTVWLARDVSVKYNHSTCRCACSQLTAFRHLDQDIVGLH